MFRASELPRWFADQQYELTRIIGSGGMAAVYSARVDPERFDLAQALAFAELPFAADRPARVAEREQRRQAWLAQDRAALRSACDERGLPIPGETVAVKIALPTMEAHVPRFEAEWQSLMAIKHPHVIEVYGGGCDGELHYYAMQLIEGCLSLEQMARAPMADKLAIVRQAALGLGCLHARGLIHRDVKPENIICARGDDGQLVARVTDLGIAKDTARSESQALTATGQLLGTPNYMAPEQVDLEAAPSPLIDVYALGATLYSMSCNRLPFEGLTLMQILNELSRGAEPISPIELSDGRIPQGLADLIHGMMEIDPGRRIASMDAVVRAIDDVLAATDDGLLRRAMTVMELPPPDVPARRVRDTRPSQQVTRRGAPGRRADTGTRIEDLGAPPPRRLPVGAILVVLLAVAAVAWSQWPRAEAPGSTPVAGPGTRPADPVADVAGRLASVLRVARTDVRTAIGDGDLAAARKAIAAAREALAETDGARWLPAIRALESDVAAEVARVFARDEKALRAALESNDRGRAKALLERMSQLDPNLPESLAVRLSSLRARYQRPVDEITLRRRTLHKLKWKNSKHELAQAREFPGAPEPQMGKPVYDWYTRMALYFLRNKRYMQALQYGLAANDHHPGHLPSLVYTAHAYVGAGSHDAAVGTVTRAIAIFERVLPDDRKDHPEVLDLYCLRGTWRLWQGELDAARADARVALGRARTHAPALFLLGSIELTAGRFAEALRALESAAANHAGRYRGRGVRPEEIALMRVRALRLLGREQQALTLARSLAASSDARLTHRFVGELAEARLLALRASSTPDELARARAMVARIPRDDMLTHGLRDTTLGLLRARDGRPRAALGAYARVEWLGSDIEACHHRGLARLAVGDTARAVSLLAHAASHWASYRQAIDRLPAPVAAAVRERLADRAPAEIDDRLRRRRAIALADETLAGIRGRVQAFRFDDAVGELDALRERVASASMRALIDRRIARLRAYRALTARVADARWETRTAEERRALLTPAVASAADWLTLARLDAELDASEYAGSALVRAWAESSLRPAVQAELALQRGGVAADYTLRDGGFANAPGPIRPWARARARKTRHFRLRSDLGEAFLGRLAKVLEATYIECRRRWGRVPRTALDVHVMRRFDDYRAHCVQAGDPGAIGGWGRVDRGAGLVVIYDGGRDEGALVRAVIRHVGRLFAAMLHDGSTPDWLSVAFGAQLDGYRPGDGSRLDFRLPQHHLRRLQYAIAEQRTLTLQTLLRTDVAAARGRGVEAALTYRAQCWALIYFLEHTVDPVYRKAYNALRDRAAAGEPLQFGTLFPDLLQLEEDVEAFVTAL